MIYVPELTTNLISVNAIINQGGEVIFTRNEVLIKKEGKIQLKGMKNRNGLYEVMLQRELTRSYLANNKQENTKLWHWRLGHLGLHNMKKLMEMSTGMNLRAENIGNSDEFCEICLKSKQVRTPHTETRRRAKRCLELIHTDVCGPIEPATWDGKRYFVTFLDDFTNFVTIYLIKNKFEVPGLVKSYVQQMENKFSQRVAKIRCDNGREYANENLQNWCNEKGIEIDYTIPYTPQLNGKAERLNRSLMEKARSLIFGSTLNKNMWGEAVYMAAYLHNRSPSKTIETTPFEELEREKPDLSRIRIFGCEAYAGIQKPLKKLEERSKKHFFVGFAPTGYRLWDPIKRKIIIARDVHFNEKNLELSAIKQLNSMDDEDEDSMDDEGTQIIEEENTKERENNVQHELIIKKEENSYDSDGDYEDSFEHEKDITRQASLQEEKIRRSERNRKAPNRYSDYAFLTYREAVIGSDRQNWLAAIQEEKDALVKNKTWTLVDADEAQDVKPLTSRWVFKVKDSGHHKARLVIRGCEQKYGINYDETFSPVVSPNSLRILFALAADNNNRIISFDVKTAFLYGNLKETIYMYPPESFNYKNKLCKLTKSLYGLKQASLNWNERFTNFLKQNDLIQLKTDQSVFKHKKSNLILAIYVDDGILIGKDIKEMDKLIKSLEREFSIKIEKDPKGFLGMEIKRTKTSLTLNQALFARQILQRFGMEDAKIVSTTVIKSENNEVNALNTSFPYRETIGSLLYLANKTRPDLAYAVNLASRRIEKPTNQDVIAVKRILRFLKGTLDKGITFYNDSKEIVAYCDSDFAGDIDSRKSTTGYVILFCGGLIAWGSKKQPTIALSSTEAEYIAASECCRELLYINSMLKEMLENSLSTVLKIDNQSTISLIKNGIINKRLKHIDVRYRFVHEMYKIKSINIEYCPSDVQLADMLTKPLGRVKFDELVGKIMT